MTECDCSPHGSGRGLVGVKQMRLRQGTGNPFGGVTLNDAEPGDGHDAGCI